jgi:ferredoxin-NADP reductase
LSTRVFPVAAVITATPSTRILRLDITEQPFTFEAGQSATIGPADREKRVPYSIASAPAEARASGRLDFLIKTEPSGRWGRQFDAVQPGDALAVDGPFGAFLFPAKPREQRFLFIAGGTGIAPIRAMIQQASLTGVPGEMKLLYSAKTADDFAYLPELRELATQRGLGLRLHVTRETPATESEHFARGRISVAQIARLVDDPETLCFVCGPESMVDAVPQMLLELGIERTRIRIEEW